VETILSSKPESPLSPSDNNVFFEVHFAKKKNIEDLYLI